MFGTASSDGQTIRLVIDRGEIHFDPELFDCLALPPGMTHATASPFIRPLWSAQATAWLADYGPLPIAYINPNVYEMLPELSGVRDACTHSKVEVRMHRFRSDRRKQVLTAITANDPDIAQGLEIALDLVLDIRRLYTAWRDRAPMPLQNHFEQLVDSKQIRIDAQRHQIDAMLWKRIEPDFAIAALIVHRWIFTLAIEPLCLTLLINEHLQIQLPYRKAHPQVLFAA